LYKNENLKNLYKIFILKFISVFLQKTLQAQKNSKSDRIIIDENIPTKLRIEVFYLKKRVIWIAQNHC